MSSHQQHHQSLYRFLPLFQRRSSKTWGRDNGIKRLSSPSQILVSSRHSSCLPLLCFRAAVFNPFFFSERRTFHSDFMPSFFFSFATVPFWRKEEERGGGLNEISPFDVTHYLPEMNLDQVQKTMNRLRDGKREESASAMNNQEVIINARGGRSENEENDMLISGGVVSEETIDLGESSDITAHLSEINSFDVTRFPEINPDQVQKTKNRFKGAKREKFASAINNQEVSIDARRRSRSKNEKNDMPIPGRVVSEETIDLDGRFDVINDLSEISTDQAQKTKNRSMGVNNEKSASAMDDQEAIIDARKKGRSKDERNDMPISGKVVSEEAIDLDESFDITDRLSEINPDQSQNTKKSTEKVIYARKKSRSKDEKNDVPISGRVVSEETVDLDKSFDITDHLSQINPDQAQNMKKLTEKSFANSDLKPISCSRGQFQERRDNLTRDVTEMGEVIAGGRRKVWKNTNFKLLSRREAAAEEVRRLLMVSPSPWDARTRRAIERIELLRSSVVICKVLRKDLPVEKCERFFNWLKNEKGFKISNYVYNSMIKRLGHARLWPEMESMVRDCISDMQHSSSTLSTVLSAYKASGKLEPALEAWSRMKAAEVEMNVVTYTIMIDMLCSQQRYEEAGEYLNQMLTEGLFPTVRTWTALISHLVGEGKMAASLQLLRLIVGVGIRPNTVTYCVLIRGYAKAGDVRMLIEMANEMREYGHRPLRIDSMIDDLKKSCVDAGDIDRVLEALWPDKPVEQRRKTYTEEKGSQIKKCSPSAISLLHPDPEAFAAALYPWTSALADSLERSGIEWNPLFVFAVLKRLKNEHVAWQFFNWVKGQPGFRHDYFTYSRMVSILLSSGDAAMARDLLKDSDGVVLSLHSYNLMIKHFIRGGDVHGAMEILRVIFCSGLQPNRVTFKHLINGLVRAKDMEKAKATLGQMLQAGFTPDAATFSHLMHGHGQAGDVKEADALFHRMQKLGVEPSESTYRTLIRIHLDSGNLFTARKYFRKLKTSGIQPSREIYLLMSKAMLKAGRHKEAGYLQKQSLVASSAISGERDGIERCQSIIKFFVESIIEN